MAFRSVAVPWLGGGLIVLGYAAFNWLSAKRSKRARHVANTLAEQGPEPLASRLQHVPDEFALDLESEPTPANDAPARGAELGALFLGRATSALSAVHFGPAWPDVRR